MTHDFDQGLAAMRAAAEASRLRILRLLAEGELTVTELAAILEQSQPRVSRHLKVLADAGLVNRHHEGAWTFYRLGDSALLVALGFTARECGAAFVALPDEDRASLNQLTEARTAAALAYFADQADGWDRLRALHIDEATIEDRLVALAGERVRTFVDLGTGTGRMLVVFKDMYDEGLGLDRSAEMLAVARAQLAQGAVTHARVQRSDFLEQPMPDDVDLVCLHHVLHFLPQPEQALAVAAKGLASDGKILIADFAPHDHEELREQFAHRRLGFADAEIARWAGSLGLFVTATEELAPPVAGGLVSRLWRLEKRASQSPSVSPKGLVSHA